VRALVLAIVLALAASTRLPAEAVPEGGGIMYGGGFAFSLRAPEGWVLDNTAARDQNVCAVFYPVGSNWKDSHVVFYVNTWKKTGEIHTPGEVAQNDVATFRRDGSPGSHVEKIKELKLSHGRVASIWQYTGDRWSNYERSAFVSERDVINVVVLTARTEKEMDDARPAFEQLVSSYEYMGKVEFKK
jgi:hypothetical protein